MAKFTVLGAGGFIGGHLVRHLRRSGHEVWAPDRGDPAVHEHDLGHVVYCIGLTTDFAANPMDTAEAHVCVLLPLLRRARFARLVYLSSVRLYDGLANGVDETTMLSFSPPVQRHVFDLSKALGEALTHHGTGSGVVARLANVYDDALGYDDFLCNTVQRALGRRDLEVDSQPQVGRDYIHADDAVRALEAIALGAREAVYNVASGVIFTNGDLAALLEREAGCHIVFRGSTSPRLPPAIDVSRLARDFDLRADPPTVRLPTILRALMKPGGKA
jgi:nucleoside-diphosphate-sugar epimerase